MFCGGALVTIEGSLWCVNDKEELPSKTCTRRVQYILSLISLRSSLLCSAFSEESPVFQYPSCLPGWH